MLSLEELNNCDFELLRIKYRNATAIKEAPNDTGLSREMVYFFPRGMNKSVKMTSSFQRGQSDTHAGGVPGVGTPTLGKESGRTSENNHYVKLANVPKSSNANDLRAASDR